jgi:hypothetical protein
VMFIKKIFWTCHTTLWNTFNLLNPIRQNP